MAVTLSGPGPGEDSRGEISQQGVRKVALDDTNVRINVTIDQVKIETTK
jgi:hypothetical protein